MIGGSTSGIAIQRKSFCLKKEQLQKLQIPSHLWPSSPLTKENITSGMIVVHKSEGIFRQVKGGIIVGWNAHLHPNGNWASSLSLFCSRHGLYEDWEISVPLTLRVWDFADHKEYYATHQFFLVERGVYVLVFDVEKLYLTLLEPQDEGAVRSFLEECLDEWLRTLFGYVPGSPVVLVGAKSDMIPKDQHQNVIDAINDHLSHSKHPFPKILSVLLVSNKNKDGIDALKREIVIASLTAQEGSQVEMGRVKFRMPLKWEKLKLKVLDKQIRFDEELETFASSDSQSHPLSAAS